jgi:hypothetical protein
MRAIDTNVLVFAEVSGSTHHETASDLLKVLAEGPLPWAIPWPCVYEFLSVVTHPKIFHPPMPIETARAALRSLMASTSLVLLSETSRHADVMEAVLAGSRASGNMIHDAHIAALCLEHGVSELVTGDRDFTRFEGLRTLDPFRG